MKLFVKLFDIRNYLIFETILYMKLFDIWNYLTFETICTIHNCETWPYWSSRWVRSEWNNLCNYLSNYLKNYFETILKLFWNYYETIFKLFVKLYQQVSEKPVQTVPLLSVSDETGSKRKKQTCSDCRVNLVTPYIANLRILTLQDKKNSMQSGSGERPNQPGWYTRRHVWGHLIDRYFYDLIDRYFYDRSWQLGGERTQCQHSHPKPLLHYQMQLRADQLEFVICQSIPIPTTHVPYNYVRAYPVSTTQPTFKSGGDPV